MEEEPVEEEEVNNRPKLNIETKQNEIGDVRHYWVHDRYRFPFRLMEDKSAEIKKLYGVKYYVICADRAGRMLLLRQFCQQFKVVDFSNPEKEHVLRSGQEIGVFLSNMDDKLKALGAATLDDMSILKMLIPYRRGDI